MRYSFIHEIFYNSFYLFLFLISYIFFMGDFFSVVTVLKKQGYNLVFESLPLFSPCTKEVISVKLVENTAFIQISFLSFFGANSLVPSNIMSNYSSRTLKAYLDVFIHQACNKLIDIYEKLNNSLIIQVAKQLSSESIVSNSINSRKNIFITQEKICRRVPVTHNSRKILGEYCHIIEDAWIVTKNHHEDVSEIIKHLGDTFPFSQIITRTIFPLPIIL